MFLGDHVQTGGCIGSSLRGEERPGAAGVCRGEWGDGLVWAVRESRLSSNGDALLMDALFCLRFLLPFSPGQH